MADEECPTWPVNYAECGPCAALENLSVEQSAAWEHMAAEFLWNWTGRVYGTCPVIVRPCRDYTVPARSGVIFQPVLVQGRWLNLGCGSCLGSRCSCDETRSLRLPGPIVSVTTVTIDGVVLPPEAYRVDNRQLLVRVDGGQWPVGQDMTADVGSVGSFAVEYVRGVPVPPQGRVAAALLACELAKAACGDSTCKLPQRIQTISRQGVTMAMLDPMDDIDKGHTGIWLIDSWIASVIHPPVASQVYSPDVPRVRDRVTTWPT